MSTFKEHLAEAALKKPKGPRIKRVKFRIRSGKIQRNVKTSNVKGFRLAAGKLVRMTSMEKLKRRRGALRGRYKRRAKASRTRLKRARSLRRRHNMGY